MDEQLTRAHTLPARYYHEPAIYQAERRAVFGREWLLFGHEDQIAESGQSLAECLAGWPIAVVRGRDGEVRGFHNVCRHRAGPVVWDGVQRSGSGLRCRYHGWTYDFDGRLLRTPDFGEAEDFDREQLGLWPIRVATWRRLVFVNLAEDAPPLEDSLGRLPELAADLPLERYRLHRQLSRTLQCNWKTYVDNYLEGYHIPYLHPTLTRDVDMKHYRVVAAERCITQDVPPRRDDDGPVTAHKGLWAMLVPNVALNTYNGGFSIERMVPTGPETMRLDFLYLFEDSAGPDQRDSAMAASGLVTGEDVTICEVVQRNLVAGVYDRGRLSPRHEGGVLYFQRWLADAVGPLA